MTMTVDRMILELIAYALFGSIIGILVGLVILYFLFKHS